MKSPINASSFAGPLARSPRAVIAALVLVLMFGIGVKMLVPLFSDDTHGGTTVSPTFQKFSDELADRIGNTFTAYHQALAHLAANPDVAAALASGSDESRATLKNRYTENVEAYQEYLKGRFYQTKRDPKNLKKALTVPKKWIRKN